MSNGGSLPISEEVLLAFRLRRLNDQTTEQYLKGFNSDALDEQMERLFSNDAT